MVKTIGSGAIHVHCSCSAVQNFCVLYRLVYSTLFKIFIRKSQSSAGYEICTVKFSSTWFLFPNIQLQFTRSFCSGSGVMLLLSGLSDVLCSVNIIPSYSTT